MDPYKTHGAFSWAELSTTDPAAAVAFYGKLFGWGSKTMGPEMGGYITVQAGEASVGGIMKTPPNAPPGMPPHWGSYVTVNDVDAICTQCKALGGSVLVEPMDIPTVGRMAVLRDPQGAVLNVITYSMPA